jgi:hypothetical protein
MTRSPFFIDTDDAQKDLLDPAFQGTANVLSSVAKAKGDVERVVLTSSVAGSAQRWALTMSFSVFNVWQGALSNHLSS